MIDELTDPRMIKMARDRQRLAWVILLGSFSICVAVTIAVPLTANAFLQNTMQLLTINVQANQGTVGIDDEVNLRRAVLVGEPAETAEPGATILTDATATALMSVYPPNSDQLLARLQVYGNSIVEVKQAETPRFGVSDAGQYLSLDLANGRLRVTMPEVTGRPFQTFIATPQGRVSIDEPGQYSLAVTNEETLVSVVDGRITVSGNGRNLDLLANQRGVIATGSGPTGPFAIERNLIANGDFEAGWEKWSQYTWKVELADEPGGHTEITPVDGEPTLRFLRIGVGHADDKIRQLINQDVTDFQSLRLQLTFRIVEQSLDVCGIRGSECPLFVVLNYVDQSGVSRTWQHGFFATGEVSDSTPNVCTSCAVVQSDHERVQLGQVQFRDVDIQSELARQGALPPSLIENIELIASGHSFEVEVMGVALLAEE